MKKTLLFVGFISLILAFSSCHPELTMDEILSQRPPYNARNVMEFRIPSAPNIENDVVLLITGTNHVSTKPKRLFTLTCPPILLIRH